MPDPHNQPQPSAEDRFAQLVKSKRERLGWSQEELARRVSVATGTPFHQTGITRIESAKRGIRLNEALILASVLGIELGPLAKTLEDHRKNAERVEAALRAAEEVLVVQQEAAYQIRVESEELQGRYEQVMAKIAESQEHVSYLRALLARERAAIEASSDGE
jgi:transcriptional regulator with XRE-family HTH domain